MRHLTSAVILVLASACGGEPGSSSPDASEPDAALDAVQADASVPDALAPDAALLPIDHPRDCAEARQGLPAAADGDYTLYVDADPARAWMAYCHGTDAFITVDPLYNYSEVSDGVSVARTSYSRLAIEARSLLLDLADATFATTTNPGGLVLPRASHIPLGWAQFESNVANDDGPYALSNLHLRDATPLKWKLGNAFQPCIDGLGASASSYYVFDSELDVARLYARNTQPNVLTRVLAQCDAMKAYASGEDVPPTVELRYGRSP